MSQIQKPTAPSRLFFMEIPTFFGFGNPTPSQVKPIWKYPSFQTLWLGECLAWDHLLSPYHFAFWHGIRTWFRPKSPTRTWQKNDMNERPMPKWQHFPTCSWMRPTDVVASISKKPWLAVWGFRDRPRDRQTWNLRIPIQNPWSTGIFYLHVLPFLLSILMVNSLMFFGKLVNS